MRIVLYIIWALFVAGVIFALVHSLQKTKRQEELIAGWPKVQATVTGNVAGWTHGGGGSTRSRRFYPTYQFADPNGTLYASESEASYANQQVPGSPLAVAYNPANPAESTLPVFVVAKGRLATGLIMVIFGATAITMFASLSW